METTTQWRAPMRFPSWLRPLAVRLTCTCRRQAPHCPTFRPRVEVLEDRACPSATLGEDIDTIAPEFARLDELTAAGSRVFFEADDRRTGNELWVSDGTAA